MDKNVPTATRLDTAGLPGTVRANQGGIVQVKQGTAQF